MHVPIKMHTGSSLLAIFNIMGKFPEISSSPNTKFPENLPPYIWYIYKTKCKIYIQICTSAIYNSGSVQKCRLGKGSHCPTIHIKEMNIKGKGTKFSHSTQVVYFVTITTAVAYNRKTTISLTSTNLPDFSLIDVKFPNFSAWKGIKQLWTKNTRVHTMQSSGSWNML